MPMLRVEIVTYYKVVVVIITQNLANWSLPYESELYMASGLGISLWRIDNPSNIIYVYSALLRYL